MKREKRCLRGLELFLIGLIAGCIIMALIEEVRFIQPYIEEYISTGSIAELS